MGSQHSPDLWIHTPQKSMEDDSIDVRSSSLTETATVAVTETPLTLLEEQASMATMTPSITLVGRGDCEFAGSSELTECLMIGAAGGVVDAVDCSQASPSLIGSVENPTIQQVAVDSTQASSMLIGTDENPTAQQVGGEKKISPEEKKRGIRPRIKEDDIFKSTPKPKTPKPTKERRVAPQEKLSFKRKYTPRKNKSNEPSSTLQDVTGVEQLPVRFDVAKKVSVAKRVLDFDLEDNNFKCPDQTCPSDNNLMQVAESSAPCKPLLQTCRAAIQLWCKCCTCLNKKMKPAFPKEYKRIRTSIRLVKARRRMLLLPTGRVIDERFKCTWTLTHSFVPTTKKRKRIMNLKVSQQGTSDSPIDAEHNDSTQSTLKGLDHSLRGLNEKATKKKEKATKGTKKQNNSINKEAKDFLKMVDFITKKFENISITSKALIPYKTKLKTKALEVDLDPETMWIMSLMHNRGEDSDPVQDTDEAKQKWWGEERKRFWAEVQVFICRLRFILGDRSFSAWKGSVVDSVVGVYLTQNVADNLSSNAFMNLASRYPVKQPSHDTFGRSAETMCDLQFDELLMPSNSEEVCNESNLTSSQGSSESIEQNVVDQGGEKCCVTGTSSAPLQHMDSPRSANVNQTPQRKTKKKGKGIEDIIIDWDLLRTTHSTKCDEKHRDPDTLDSVDWDAIRKADVNDIANTIKDRGQNNVLAKKIKDFLDRIVKDHGSIDLEWLRDVPPEKVKEYLLDIYGLGLKSVECLRLLTLHHHAFPVDTNVGRIAIRLGWVPLRMPTDESLQIHLIENYPVMDKIQAYLWPRLCHLDQKTLYELHYMLITFGKVFCTKRNPHCNACPLRGECKHYEDACASARLALPGIPQKSSKEASEKETKRTPFDAKLSQLGLTWPMDDTFSTQAQNCEPIIEEPPSPKPECATLIERDIEDLCTEDPDEIPFINLCAPRFVEYMNENVEKGMASAVVALSPEVGSKPAPKQKLIARLRTEHQVYELDDSHPLLEAEGLEKREEDDPSHYLLAIWTQGDGQIQEQDDTTVPGTLLIPCRSAMRGRFPLNGTYFQVNEVFADDETSNHPINVPRGWIWSLNKRTLYCGSTTTAISKGLSSEQVMDCFRRGFVCVRGFNRKTRAPKPLSLRFHLRLKAVPKKNIKKDEEESKKTD